jgi:hypothetical protein
MDGALLTGSTKTSYLNRDWNVTAKTIPHWPDLWPILYTIYPFLTPVKNFCLDQVIDTFAVIARQRSLLAWQSPCEPEDCSGRKCLDFCLALDCRAVLPSSLPQQKS